MLKSLNLKIIEQTSPYIHTPYENLSKDFFNFFINKLQNKTTNNSKIKSGTRNFF